MENHNYFDYSHMPTPDSIPVKRKSRAISSFLKKTYEILEVTQEAKVGSGKPLCGEMGC